MIFFSPNHALSGHTRRGFQKTCSSCLVARDRLTQARYWGNSTVLGCTTAVSASVSARSVGHTGASSSASGRSIPTHYGRPQAISDPSRAKTSGFISGIGFGISGFGFRVSGFGVQVCGTRFWKHRNAPNLSDKGCQDRRRNSSGRSVGLQSTLSDSEC
eukprot:2748575-Rhodomonas_salina.1